MPVIRSNENYALSCYRFASLLAAVDKKEVQTTDNFQGSGGIEIALNLWSKTGEFIKKYLVLSGYHAMQMDLIQIYGLKLGSLDTAFSGLPQVIIE